MMEPLESLLDDTTLLDFCAADNAGPNGGEFIRHDSTGEMEKEQERNVKKLFLDFWSCLLLHVLWRQGGLCAVQK